MIAAARAPKYQALLGVLIGLAAAQGVLSVYDGGAGGSPQRDDGPLLSDCDGALREVVIHYEAGAADVVGRAYQAFLRQIPDDVTVYAVCPDERAFADLVARVGSTGCRLSPVVVNHAVTAWSRDRWLCLASPEGERTVLLRPRGEDGANLWPAREGDQRVAADLAAARGPGLVARCSDLYFDGGDFAADRETVFVRPAVLLRNLQRTVATREELVERLAAMTKRRVVLLHDAPDHHTAMYLMPAGDRTVLVGDPRMARQLLAQSPRNAVDSYLPGGADFSEATFARFDAVAEQCRAAGYRVVGIPVIPGSDGRTYITYVNAILDERDGGRVVYMPTFRCAEVLNRAAAAVWRTLGYEVRPVECDACARHFGALHCLVNVLRRD
jgi:hypothetical protein